MGRGRTDVHHFIWAEGRNKCEGQFEKKPKMRRGEGGGGVKPPSYSPAFRSHLSTAAI